jgi:cysteinyl-tRNA synthetase
MAISFTNNWKNILDKLQSVIRAEFGSTLKVYRGKAGSPGNQYLALLPLGTTLSNYNVSSEIREFFVNMEYHFRDPNMNERALDHVTRIVSRIEALIQNNIAMTLTDGSSAFNCRIDSTNLGGGDESEYIVVLEWACQHLGNAG